MTDAQDDGNPTGVVCTIIVTFTPTSTGPIQPRDHGGASTFCATGDNRASALKRERSRISHGVSSLAVRSERKIGQPMSVSQRLGSGVSRESRT